MSIKSLRSGYKGISMLAGNLQWSDFDSIATVTVTAATQGTIEFTSIPNEYQHLQIRGIGRTNRASATSDSLRMRFNSDSGNNYSYHFFSGNGTSTAVEGTPNTSVIAHGCLTATNATSTQFGVAIIDILDYANTNKYKTSRSIDGFERNGAGSVEVSSGNWRNTNAITSIQLTALGSFVTNSTFALYGIKG
jgi:hypothetical protein